MKKVRCINDNGMSNLENGQIYEVELVYNDLGGEPLYRLKGVSGSKYASRFEEVIEPDFKIGDTVKVIKEDVEFDRPHVGKVAKIRKITPTGSYYLEGIGIHMYAEQLELVSERRFKVGDVVKIKDIPPARRWNFDGQMDYLKGKSEKIIGFGARSNEYLVMATTRWRDYWVIEDDDIECLAPEPKPEPKFKVGDFVKGIGNRYGVTNSHMTKGVVRYVGDEDEIGVQRLERDGEPISDDIVFDVSEEYFELWEEPKPIVKERATVKKVRCIDATYSRNLLETNKVYVIEVEGEDSLGREYYCFKSTGVQKFHKSRFVDVIEEKYPQIEYLADGTKVVFNPPYTIVERNGLVGKVKCYHKDEYTKWGGYTEALKVMKPCLK